MILSGEVVCTNVVAAGGQLSDRVTGLGEIHNIIMCYDLECDTNMRTAQHAQLPMAKYYFQILI